MPFSYDPRLATPKDKVRFFVGDTDKERAQIQDEEILSILTITGGKIYSACAIVCEHLAAKFARIKERRGGVSSVSFENVARDYINMAKKFKIKAAIEAGGLSFVMPSMSESQKQMNRQDTDLTQASFHRNMHDHPETSQDKYTYDDDLDEE